MNKNTIHNFNLSIKNSASSQSPEDLTKTIIKELAQVSKEINEQKDITQIWQEQNALTALVNNTIDSTGEGVFDIYNAAIKTATSYNTTSSVSEAYSLKLPTFNASIGGGVTDTTESTIMSSFASVNNTLPVSKADNDILDSSLSEVYESVDTKQTLTVPQTLQVSNDGPSIEIIKAEIQNKLDQARKANNLETIQYWTRISKAFDEGATAKKFDGKKDHELFTKMYFGLQKWHLSSIPETAFNNVNWGDVSELMILKLIELSKDSREVRIKEYYKNLILEIKKPNVDINRLFLEHDELFVLLKSVFPILPGKITIQTRKVIYPNLGPKQMYPDIGAERIYYIWSGTELDDIEVKSAIGEKVKNKDGKYPVLKEGEWYDYDRINNADKKGSTFWNASIYNTLNAQHYFYNTIAERHAYYKFVDAYLKTKGIISEWFDAAARVTVGSIKDAMQGELALGSAEMMNLWYLSDASEEFLKGGNRYLFSDNMQNVKLLLEGKGKLSGEFIDAKGNKQSFKNLSKQELDLKLVEFEQSLVQDYINSYLKDLDINLMKKALSEAGVTGNDELDEIVAEINENFTLWMAPDLTEDIMQKYFTTNGKVTFNFAKYDDRVKLGQVMVKELYYLRLSDTFKADNIDKILKNPLQNSDKTTYFIIDQQTAVKEREKYLKEYKILERLERIYKKLKNKSTDFNEVENILDDVYDGSLEEIRKSLAVIKKQIKKSLKSIGDEVSNTALDMDEILYNDLMVIVEDIKKEFETTRASNPDNQKNNDLTEKLYADMAEIYELGEKLRKKLLEEAKETVNTVTKEGKKLLDKSASNALVRNAERIYPGVSKLEDSKKEILFKSSYEATVAILLYEFATGTGPEIRNFDLHEHKFAQAVLNGRMIDEIMEETLKLLRQTNYDFTNKPDSKDLKVDLEFSPTPTYLIEMIDKHLDSNLAQMFIGGAFALVRIKNKKLEGYIYNETGRKSLMLHAASDLKRNNKGKKETILSSIKQRIYFTFKLP